MLRSAFVVLCLTFLSKTAFGFWQSNGWALTSEDEAGLGYDSNLFARYGGAGDGYALLEPNLTIQRLGSFTKVTASFTLKSTDYFTRTDLNSLDPSLDIELSYPYDEFVFPTERFSIVASRSTVVDGDVGGRLREQDLGAHWDGNIWASEKTIFQGRAEIHQTDYLTEGFNNNEYATAGLTLAYVANEHLDLGFGYDYKYSESLAKSGSTVESDFRQNLITIRGRGDFLPKVSGFFYAGLASTGYQGSVTNSYLDFLGGLSLVWTATERGKLTLKVSRDTYFSPDGFAFIPTSVGPEWTEELIRGFSVTLGVSERWTQYRQQVATDRNDRALVGDFQIQYSLNPRYSASLVTQYTRQTSPGLIYNYDRATIVATLSGKF